METSPKTKEGDTQQTVEEVDRIRTGRSAILKTRSVFGVVQVEISNGWLFPRPARSVGGLREVVP